MAEEEDRPEKPPKGLTGPVVEHGQKPDPKTEYRGDRD